MDFELPFKSTSHLNAFHMRFKDSSMAERREEFYLRFYVSEERDQNPQLAPHWWVNLPVLTQKALPFLFFFF